MARGTKLAGSDVMENWCRVRRVLLLPPLLFALGCTMPPPPAAQPEPPPRSDASVAISPEAAAIEDGVFIEVNRLRREHGRGALRRLPALDQAARLHSAELAARRMLDHYSTDVMLRTPGQRVTAKGIVWISVAENLASMSGAYQTAGWRTGDVWMHSPGHRSNMLEERYTHTGVGVAIDRRGIWYVTQLYVLPRGAR
jgi:uncharacterized protein YkwD